jgi:hypothetical protein
MRQEEVFETLMKQLGETLKDYRETVNPKDRLHRAEELCSYLRGLTNVAERIRDEAYRHAPHLAAKRMLHKYKNLGMRD